MLAFVPITRANFELIGRWLAESEVDRWWHDDPSPAGIEAQFGPIVDGTDPTEVFVVYEQSTAVGLIQRYQIDDEIEYRAELAGTHVVPPAAVSMDYFIGDEAQRGRGLGPRMVAELVADTWRVHRNAPAVIIAVQAGNQRSWRTLERAGFRRVAEGELTPDNPIDTPHHVIYRIDRPDDLAGYSIDRSR
jgi:aminoglycoside 6'-N-acetyltransferase